jgi:glycosyltransferase involved in cell wall biosynthesis
LDPRASHEVWHLITCEYPPDIGGVSDHTFAIAEGLLAAGRDVHVWAPATSATASVPGGAVVHRVLGGLRPSDLRRAGAELNAFPRPRRLLVQWVPHGYGYRSLNLALAYWIACRALVNRDEVDLLIHEPFLAWSTRPALLLASLIHRLMLCVAAVGSTRTWVTIPAWATVARRYLWHRPISWLPVPSSVAVTTATAETERLRDNLAPNDAPLVGHFSRYSPSIARLLEPALREVLERNRDLRVVLIGKGSEAFKERLQYTPDLLTRIHATGVLDPRTLSLHLQMCDVMLQPYPDGVSSRRTTAVALLAHRSVVVTNGGWLTDTVWRERSAVRLVDDSGAVELASAVGHLLQDATERRRLRSAAAGLYSEVFDVRHAIASLLNGSSAQRTRWQPSIAQ